MEGMALRGARRAALLIVQVGGEFACAWRCGCWAVAGGDTLPAPVPRGMRASQGWPVPAPSSGSAVSGWSVGSASNAGNSSGRAK